MQVRWLNYTIHLTGMPVNRSATRHIVQFTWFHLRLSSYGSITILLEAEKKATESTSGFACIEFIYLECRWKAWR